MRILEMLSFMVLAAVAKSQRFRGTNTTTTTSTISISMTTTTSGITRASDGETNPMDAVLSETWFATLCATTQHVICDDAVCKEPIDGLASCNCRRQNTTASILPSGVAGAPALTGSVNYGLYMCLQMNAGILYSAFSPTSVGFSTMKLAKCSISTDFPFCWGAPCEANATHPDRATCRCPVQTMDSMPVYMDQFIVASTVDCGVGQKPSTCDRIVESGREWMATVVGAFAPEVYLDDMACNWRL